MLSENIIIRPAKPADLDDIIRLISLLAEFDNSLSHLQIDREGLKAALFAEHPKTNALLAEYEGAVVGISTYYFTYSTFICKPGIWLDDLFIVDGYRKLGIGKALLDELQSIARKNHCGRIDWLVAASNKNGIEFYEKMGATVFEAYRQVRLDPSLIEKQGSL
jgi:GNAT superfamily N-acetyltransferase